MRLIDALRRAQLMSSETRGVKVAATPGVDIYVAKVLVPGARCPQWI